MALPNKLFYLYDYVRVGMMRKKLSCTILFSFFSLWSIAQGNLVPNPSFETYTTCPSDFGQINFTGNWYPPTGGTSDYFNACETGTNVDVPGNYFGSQQAFNGSAYAGFITYSDLANGYREYIQTQLTSTLTAGQKYYLSFYVSLAENSLYSVDGMGAYFSQTPIWVPSTVINIGVIPQVSNLQGQVLADAVNWKQIAGDFIAFGGEEYITIGNFKNNVNTSKVQRSPIVNLGLSYYYVDQVCLSLSPQTCGVKLDVGIKSSEIKTSAFYYNSSSSRIIFEDKTKEYFVKIMDLYGNEIKVFKVDQANEIDVSGLKSGCYFIMVSGSKSTEVKKIIIE